MLNGWFTIVAQAVNFLILVWLLKRFLYKPILHAIDEREKGIATQLSAAKAKEAEAEKERVDLQHKNEAFNQERAALMAKATDDAKAERQKLNDEAKKDADAFRTKRQAALQIEQQSLNQEIVRWTRDQVFAIARKTLGDLAGTSLEERMGDVFVRRIGALTGPDKEQMATAFKTSNHTLSVRSAFDLPEVQQEAITKALIESFAPDAKFQFETAPDLVSGIELSTNGLKLSWSIEDYLSTLKERACELVHAEATPQPKPSSKSKSDDKPEPKADAKPETKPGAKSGPNGDVQPVLITVAPERGADH